MRTGWFSDWHRVLGNLFAVIALGAAIDSGAMIAIFCFLTVAAVVAFGVPLILVTPTYIFEDISVWRAYVRGFRLGWSTWGGIFGLGFVLSLLSNVVSFVFVMPWEVCVFVKTLFVQAYAGEETFVGSVAFVILQYIFGVVMWIGSYLIYNLFLSVRVISIVMPPRNSMICPLVKVLTILRKWQTRVRMMTIYSKSNHFIHYLYLL